MDIKKSGPFPFFGFYTLQGSFRLSYAKILGQPISYGIILSCCGSENTLASVIRKDFF